MWPATPISFLVLIHNVYFTLANTLQQTPFQDAFQHISGASQTRIINAEFSKFVENEVLARRGVKGMALAIVKPDEDVEFGTWGVRNENDDDFTPDTLFCIASCSKAFLVTSIGILMDDYAAGRNSTPLPSGLSSFDWDTKMKDLLPNDWKLQDQWASEFASVMDVLSHVSGLPRHDLSYSPADTPLDVIRRMRYLQPTFELREKWSYNNQMFMTVAHLLSTLTGTSYPDFVRKRIFDPLGIPSDSGMFSPSDAERTGKLSETWMAQDKTTLLRIPFWFNEHAAKLSEGAGGVIVSVRELSKWLKLLLNKGVRPDTNNTVIPRSVYDAMTTATAIMQGAGSHSAKYGVQLSVTGYGMGWSRHSVNGYDLVSHTGSIPGFKTFVGFLPNEKLGIAVTFNTELGPGNGDPNMDVVMRVLRDALGIKKDASTRFVNDPLNPEKYNFIHFVNSEEGETEEDDVKNTAYATEAPEPISSLAGTYTNEGYGTFALCARDTKSEYCDKVREDFGRVDCVMAAKRIVHGKKTWVDSWEKKSHGIINYWTNEQRTNSLGLPNDARGDPIVRQPPRPIQLLAAWPRIWATHLRLVYLSSSSRNVSIPQTIHEFAVRPSALFPKGYGDDSQPREPFELPVFENEGLETWATAEFVVENGKVVGAGVSGKGLVPEDATRWMKERETGDVKKDSLVWFERAG